MNTTESLPTFSIVMAVHDEAPLLRERLPAYLAQDFPQGSYEVVVVDEASTDETHDVLEQLKSGYAQLYTTFLPRYEFQPNRHKMALAIGVKAARHARLILANIGMPPPAPRWLAGLASAGGAEAALLLGYADPRKGTERLLPFDDLDKARRIISRTEHRRTAGKRRWLPALRGDYDYIVVDRARGHDTLRLFADESYRL